MCACIPMYVGVSVLEEVGKLVVSRETGRSLRWLYVVCDGQGFHRNSKTQFHDFSMINVETMSLRKRVPK